MIEKRKTILIVGGGYADIPLIKAAKDLDYYVITSGNRPDELGHTISDEYWPADFSDPDAIFELAKKLDVDAICPCCNDFSAISSAYAAEKLGLPGFDSYETSQLIHHKDSYREFAKKNAIASPNARGFDNIEEVESSIKDFRFPLIVKPVDLTGGKGIMSVADLVELKSALQEAFKISKLGRVVVEEFIEGSRHGFSAFICEGKVVFHFTDNELYYLNQYMVSAALAPSTVPESAIHDLISQSEKISQILSLKNGIFHVQFILRDDKPVIIEICRRPPGDLYIKLVELATGIDYSSWIVRAFCGLDCSGLRQNDVTGYFLRHCVMASNNGVLSAVDVEPTIKKNIIDSMMWGKSGDTVDNFLVAKFGIVFLKFNSMDELLNKSANMQNLICANVSKNCE
ncbi:MAG: ATP-grasp domain-containing protein [Thiotrichaceae bacterium]|nr:ATP-grasp domain-containing protein [Thiotrichaceae bacterium]